ncbi:hypothetical protein Hanom_Chr06g00532471 [Helianthus anomalus]
MIVLKDIVSLTGISSNSLCASYKWAHLEYKNKREFQKEMCGLLMGLWNRGFLIMEQWIEDPILKLCSLPEMDSNRHNCSWFRMNFGDEEEEVREDSHGGKLVVTFRKTHVGFIHCITLD